MKFDETASEKFLEEETLEVGKIQQELQALKNKANVTKQEAKVLKAEAEKARTEADATLMKARNTSDSETREKLMDDYNS